MAREASDLTDNEGTLLGLVVRAGPLTAYQIARVYERSPVSNFNTSKGKLYPLIRRLRERGLLAAESVEGDARGTEKVRATAAGKEAVRRWAREIRPTHLLPEDPLRTKLQSFDLLSRDERIAWCVAAKAMLKEKLDEVEGYGETVEVPFRDLVHENAVSTLRGRMDWLDRVLQQLVLGDASQPAD